MHRRRRFAFCVISSFLMLLLSCSGVNAQEDGPLKQQIDELNAQVKQKQSRVKEVEALIAQYQKRIAEQESMQVSLQNEIALLDNRIQEKQLMLERTKTERDALALEISALDDRILQEQAHIVRQQELIADLVRRIRQADSVSTMDVLLTQPTLSTFFDQVERVKRLQRSLGGSVDQLKQVKASLESLRTQRTKRQGDLAVQEAQIKKDQQALDDQRGFKTSLVSETQSKEEEFQRLLYELKQQEQSTTADIADLKDRLKGKLDAIDASLARGDILLNWPIRVSRVSAVFHDPTYPFRKLFEHPGIDLPAPVGTPIRAAAGGYIAWTRTGKAYGNYVMVVHPGNIATVYAHMTKFFVKPDTYVERGQVIGLSGGRPGDQGAGLSTGPHVHFEVRQNGIPVNPENFLPDLGF